MRNSLADELSNCKFGDKRLTSRVISLCTSISENPELSINSACGSFEQSKAAYRFLDNDKVNTSNLLSAHVQKTCDRIAASSGDIIVIQDTTDLIYTQFPSISDLGERIKSAGYGSSVKGILLHTSLAVDPAGVPLGVLKQTFFTYDEGQVRKRRSQTERNVVGITKQLPIEQKSSFRWIDHFHQTEKITQELKRRIIHVADREADIYELIQAIGTSPASKFVIRSSMDRKTHEDPTTREFSTIEKQLLKVPISGTVQVLKDGKEKLCQVKILKTTLKPPSRSAKAKSEPLVPISVIVVEVRENSSAKDALHWRLLTNLACASFDEAVNVIATYKKRWSIESFHRILKSGFGVEKARLSCRSKLEKLATLLSIISWHLYWLYNLSRKSPLLKGEVILDEIAIKVLKVSAKKVRVQISKSPTLGEAILIIARLGGFLGRKSDGQPGMISIWRGWRCLYERIELMEALTCG